MTTPIAPVQVRYTVDGVERVITASKRITDNLEAATAASIKGRAGFAKFGSGVSNLALNMVGLQGASGKAAEGLLMMGIGGPVTIAVAAGLALIGAAYVKLTQKTRDAAKAQKELNDEYDKALQSRNPVPKLTKDAESFTAQIRAIDAQLATLRASQGTVIPGTVGGGRFVGSTPDRLIDNTREITRLDGERAKLLQRMGEAGQKLSDFYAQTPEAKKLADEADRQAKALEKARDALAKVLEMQHQLRIVAAGGGDRTAGSGGTPPLPTDVPPILRGHRGESGAEGDVLTKKFEDQRAAAKALGNEIRFGLATALTDFVSRGVSQGNILLGLFQSLLQAAQQIASVLLQRLFLTAIGGAAGGGGARGNSTQSGFHAAGGLITGPGTGTSDSIPARLSNGEFVVNAAATAQNFDLLSAINDMGRWVTPHSFGSRGYATGGLVSGGSHHTLTVDLPEGMTGRVTSASDVLDIIVRHRRSVLSILG